MKPLSILFFSTLALVLYFPHTSLHSQDLSFFSENQYLYISKLTVVGRRLLSQKDFEKITELREKQSYLVWQIRKAIQRLNESGYIKKDAKIIIVKDQITKNLSKEGYHLIISINEENIISNMKVIDEVGLSHEQLYKYMKKYDFAIGKLYSAVNLKKAIHDFEALYQSSGQFLFKVHVNVILESEYDRKEATESTISDQFVSQPIVILVYIEQLSNIRLRKVYFTGEGILNFQDLMKILLLKEDSTISHNDQFFIGYKRLRRSGYFTDVFYDLQPVDNMENTFDLLVVVEDIQLERVNFTGELKEDIGFLVSGQYFNFAMFNSRDRFVVALGYEADYNSFIFSTRYTNPALFNRYFIDVLFQKSDEISPKTDFSILRENYSVNITAGMEFLDNLSGFLISSTAMSIRNTIYTNDASPIISESPLFSTSLALLLSFNNLNDNFNPTQGMKLYLTYEPIISTKLSHKIDFSGELYLTNNFRTTLAFFVSSSVLFTDDPAVKFLSTSDNDRSNVHINKAIQTDEYKATFYASAELRYYIGDILSFVTVPGTYFIFFTEMGSVWEEIINVKFSELNFGLGFGIRYSPSLYSDAFFIGYPAGIYIGFQVANPNEINPKFTIRQHRDKYFYINLTVAY